MYKFFYYNALMSLANSNQTISSSEMKFCQILGVKTEQSQVFYKIQWSLRGQKEIRWEPTFNLANYMYHVVRFRVQNSFQYSNDKQDLSQSQSNSILSESTGSQLVPINYLQQKFLKSALVSIKRYPISLEIYEAQLVNRQTGKLQTLMVRQQDLKKHYLQRKAFTPIKNKKEDDVEMIEKSSIYQQNQADIYKNLQIFINVLNLKHMQLDENNLDQRFLILVRQANSYLFRQNQKQQANKLKNMKSIKQDYTSFDMHRNEQKLPKLSSSINIQDRKNKPRSQTQQERRSILVNELKTQNNNNKAKKILQMKSQRQQQATKKNYSQSVAFLNIPSNTINSKSQKIGKNNYNTNLDQIKSKQLIYQSSLLLKIKQKNNKAHSQNNNSQLRSRILSTFVPAMIQQSNLRSNPYDKFIKQLNIKLPTPQEKFKEFVRIPPFNRLKNHTEFISHMLQKISSFFRNHPSQIVENIAKKIVELHHQNISENYLVILSEGCCTYKGKKIDQGMLITRKDFSDSFLEYQGMINLIGVPCHEYTGFLTAYLRKNKNIFQRFIESMQIFKIFSQEGLSKIYSNLEINFYQKGQFLYQPGQVAQDLFIIYQGCAARKIIIQIDKTNKIPLEKFSKLVKIISTSYEHRILFQKEDLVGIADIVDNIYKRSEDIIIDEDSTILGIKRGSVQQNLDEYIVDRLRKYNMKKYPKNYDQLCENYLKSKTQNRKAEQRKIEALKDEIFRDCHNERKGQKINQIIKIYQKRIKQQEKEHLVNVKSIEREIRNDL